jgi:hypothetical protein
MLVNKKPIISLTVVILLLATAVMAETISLPGTGQTACYDEFGSEITCSGTGQDGDIRAGLAWPATRFTVQGDGNCLLDNLTGLTWAKTVPTVRKYWDQAFDYIGTLNATGVCGYGDWRLPNINELESLNNLSRHNIVEWLSDQGFVNAGWGWYWSSTSVPTTDTCLGCAFVMDVNSGGGLKIGGSAKYTTTEFVWPVRGDSLGPAQLWWTGQSTKYHLGDDGYLQKGVGWNSGRYVLSGTVVTDNLTGLMWTGDANAPGPALCGPGTAKSWQQALTYVKCLNDQVYLDYADWRVPNVTEMLSIVDRSQVSPALTPNHPFWNVQPYLDYWTSTSRDGGGFTSSYAWYVNMMLGTTDFKDKRITTYTYVWPVRGGTVAPPAVDVTLTVAIGGNKKGTVAATGLTCPKGKTTCTGVYTSGTVVTVTAAAVSGSAFDSFSGCDSADGNVCQVTMDAAKTVTASFGTPAGISVAPTSLNFGPVKAGSSTSKTVNISSTGGIGLAINALGISGAGEFTQTSTGCDVPLAKGNKCFVTVTFSPLSYGTEAAQLVIASNDQRKTPLSVKLAGTVSPPKIAATPATVNFGAAKTGTTSAPRKITVKNTGLSNLTFTSISLPAGLFAISQDNCTGRTLAQNASCDLYVTFAPQTTDKSTTQLTIVSNDPDVKRSTTRVNLSGQGKLK